MAHKIYRTAVLALIGSLHLFPAFAEPDATNLEVQPTAASPYTLPWQLRPVTVGNVIRLDTAFAMYSDRNGNSGGLATAGVLTGAYKLMPDIALLARFGIVQNTPPAGGLGATSITNPLIGGVYSISLPSDLRLGLFLGMTLPVGMGGGNTPISAVQSANAAGLLARSAMDNALFAVNYLTVIPGVGLAYIAHDLTVQVEATLLQLIRTRGELVDTDTARTNLTAGLALGYAFTPIVAAMGELRYQRWLSNQTVAGAAHPATENLSFAIGPRFTFKVGTFTFKPGIAYAQGLAGPMANGTYTSATNSDKVVYLDLPMIF